MKYLKYREKFLNKEATIDGTNIYNQMKSSEMISEAFENDITWGGSLLGRLINSVIRKGKIYTKNVQINGIAEKVKQELDQLIADSQPDDIKGEIDKITAKFLIEEIYKIVNSNSEITSKVTSLVGDSNEENPGLIEVTISNINKIEIENKDQLINKLKNFKNSIKDISKGENTTQPEEKAINNDDKIYDGTISLLKSIIGLSDVIKNDKVNIEKSSKEEVKTTQKEEVKKDNKGESDSPSIPTEKERSLELSESLFYENESLPIFESTEVKSNETHARLAWGRVESAYSKSGMSQVISRIQTLVDKSDSDVEKKWVINIGKQIIANEQTIGRSAISFEQLIKESSIPTSYSDIPKSISLFANVILAFRKDIGLSNLLGEASEYIKKFISSYDMIKNLIPTKKSESIIYRYTNFVSLQESDDIKPEENKNPQTENEIKSERDIIQEKWYDQFKEGEEKEWKVDESETKDTQSKIEEMSDKPIYVDADSVKDNIIRIVNLFGKAYDLYATTIIPSGRPNGRISQKTFREYEYVGNGTPNQWSQDGNPGYGPWAVKMIYNKWDASIMKILEDTKYRKIFANVKFKAKGPNQKEGSGLTLFTFISDMIGYGREDRDFRSKRQRLLTKYFNIEEISKKTNYYGYGNSNPLINEDDVEDEIRLVYTQPTYNITKSSYKEKDKGLLRQFIRITYETADKHNQMMTIFLNSYLKKDNMLMFKFHLYGTKQSMFNTYLKDTGFKMPEEVKEDKNVELYIGGIDIDKGIFTNDPMIRNIEFNYVEAQDLKTQEKFDKLKIKVRKIEFLSYSKKEKDKDKYKLMYPKVDKVKSRPAKDISLKDLADEIINKFKIKDDKEV